MVKQYYSTELYHHGVKGQKWGVRRYQDYDGTTISFGNSGQSKINFSNNYKKIQLTDKQKTTAKKVAIGVGVAAAAAGTAYYLSKHPEKLTSLKTLGKSALKSLGNATKQAGKDAIASAIVAVGPIAISKLTPKLQAKEGDSEKTINTKKIAYAASKSAITSVTNSAASAVRSNKNDSNNKNSNKSGRDYSKAVGFPTKRTVDTSSRDYQELMKSPYKEDIKAMRKAGYDIDQLKIYASMSHGLILDKGVYFSVIKNDELLHTGVRGMKWGVRRYQNYDGSYTQAGMKRYNKSMEKYEKASERYKQAKRGASDGGVINTEKRKLPGDKYALVDGPTKHKPSKWAKVDGPNNAKIELTNARMAKKQAKRQLEKDYKHLAEDKRADKGKELYSKGHTITNHKKVNSALTTVGAVSILAAKNEYQRNGNPKVVNALTAIGGASIAASAAKGAVDASRNRNLRAYYSHTSNY